MLKPAQFCSQRSAWWGFPCQGSSSPVVDTSDPFAFAFSRCALAARNGRSLDFPSLFVFVVLGTRPTASLFILPLTRLSSTVAKFSAREVHRCGWEVTRKRVSVVRGTNPSGDTGHRSPDARQRWVKIRGKCRARGARGPDRSSRIESSRYNIVSI